MNPAEYAKLEEVDRRHWFYRGKRGIVRHWIEIFHPLSQDDLLIDAGCGTGALLAEMGGMCRILGLDDHDESIALTRPKIERFGGNVIKTPLHHVELEDGCATVVTLLDVLEHIDDDAGALTEMIRLVRPGGLIIITVPALMMLWSDWDVALHHRRRYSKPQLLRLIRRAEVEVLRCVYINSLVLPVVYAVRTWRRLRPLPPGAPRAEDKIPRPALNTLLFHALVQPAIRRWCKPPLGVSLMAVLRRVEMPAGLAVPRDAANPPRVPIPEPAAAAGTPTSAFGG
ncbi:MAG TPA: class I SAM-dependent methyltransferase [Phycisphaerae bacterium]|nr:class I SAM-dependent methyltransferase [Phycisphaerae bacterium]HNU46926.1 class I SAM-dependent methyltransferase [Phycisphaerae bacterium]